MTDRSSPFTRDQQIEMMRTAPERRARSFAEISKAVADPEAAEAEGYVRRDLVLRLGTRTKIDR